MKYFCLSISTLFLISSCASVYQTIDPTSQSYYSSNQDSAQGVIIEHSTGVLSGNYAARAGKLKVSLAAVKITNNSGKVIIPENNLAVFSEKKEVEVMNVYSFTDIVKQDTRKYAKFLYLLPFNVYSFNKTTHGDEVTSNKSKIIPIGLVLGPALTLINQGIAKTANKKLLKELDEYDILKTEIKPGETVYGLIALDVAPDKPVIFSIQ